MIGCSVRPEDHSMWDDSSDSMLSPSPDAKKKNGKNTYDYPTSYASKGKTNNKTVKSANDDIDQLFGDSTDFSQSEGSPLTDKKRKNERSIPDYTLPTTSSKPNYLSNFKASSQDFEDSILGELLGGTGLGKQRDSVPASPRSTSPQTRLEKVDPLEDSTNSLPRPSRGLGRHSSAPAVRDNDKSAGSTRNLVQPQKAQSFRFATELSSAESSPIKPTNKPTLQSSGRNGEDSIERIPEHVLPSTKTHHNSFDMDIIMESSGEFTRSSSKPGYMPTLTTSRDSSDFGRPSGKMDNSQQPAPITTKSLDRGSLPSVDKNDDDEDAGINFIPSFLDPGRNGRRRRQLDRPSTTGGIDTSSGAQTQGSTLDELDAILGIGAAPNSKTADPVTKTVVDPFAAVEKRSFPKPPVILDSDSSDDDGIFRSKPKKKESFFGKPASNAGSKEPESHPVVPNIPVASSTTSSVPPTSTATAGNSGGNSSNVPSALMKGSNNPRSPSALTSALPALTSSGSRLSSPSTGTSAANTPGSSTKRHHRPRFAMDEEESQDGASTANKTTKNNKGTKDYLEDSGELDSSTGVFRTRSDDNLRRPNANKHVLPVNTNHDSASTPAPAPSPQGQGIQLTRRSVSAASRLSPSKPTATTSFTSAGPPIPTADDTKATSSAAPEASKANATDGTTRTAPSTNAASSTASTSAPAATSTKVTRFADELESSQEFSKFAEKSRQQRQVNDRRMEDELQQMRSKIDQLTTSNNSQASSVAYASKAHSEESREKQILLDQNLQLQQMQMDSKRIISALEIEINRLKDEINIQAAKHIDTLKHQQETFEQDVSNLKTQHRLEVDATERRHSDSVAALKKVHGEEILSWKERYKGAEVFETITQQIRNTTGSMKYLEEQLQQRHRNVEMMREGQFEAREKILIEMEEKARERAESAEAEGYKLKGILQHMQQMVDSLRFQGVEDKQRLVQEHQRIKSLQDSFDQDKKNFYLRCQEETQMLKLRSQDVERDMLQWNQEKLVQLESINAARRKLENERTELQAYNQAQKLNLENMESALREEEKRLQRQREEFHQEKYAFEQRKLQASREIEEADEMKRMLNNAAKKLHQELDSVAMQSHKIQMDQEELMQAQQELIRQREALELREQTLREGLLEMRQAATSLTTQELQVQSSMRQLEQRRKDLDSLDRDIATRRVNQAAAFRESLEFHQEQGHHNINLSGFQQLMDYGAAVSGGDGVKENLQPIQLNVGPLDGDDEEADNSPEVLYPSPHYKSSPTFFNSNTLPPPIPRAPSNRSAPAPTDGAPGQSWATAFQQQLRNAYIGTAAQHAPTFGSRHASGIDVSVLPDRALPKEVRLAQRQLKETRLNLQRVSTRSLNTKLTLHNDEDFLRGLRTNSK